METGLEGLSTFRATVVFIMTGILGLYICHKQGLQGYEDEWLSMFKTVILTYVVVGIVLYILSFFTSILGSKYEIAITFPINIFLLVSAMLVMVVIPDFIASVFPGFSD